MTLRRLMKDPDTEARNIALARAARDGAQLVLALREIGWRDAHVERIPAGGYDADEGRSSMAPGGYYLYIEGAPIAGGFHEFPDVAMEELLDRAADLFYFDIPEV